MSAHFIMTCGDAKWLQLGVITGLGGGANQAVQCIPHRRKKIIIKGEKVRERKQRSGCTPRRAKNSENKKGQTDRGSQTFRELTGEARRDAHT